MPSLRYFTSLPTDGKAHMRHSFLKGQLGCFIDDSTLPKAVPISTCSHGPSAAAQKTYENGQDPNGRDGTYEHHFRAGRDSTVLVHWVHDCLLSSQQSLAHRRSRGKQHSQAMCPLGFTSLNKVDDIQGKKVWFCTSSSNTDLQETRLVYRNSLKDKEEQMRQCRSTVSTLIQKTQYSPNQQFSPKFGSQFDILNMRNLEKIENGTWLSRPAHRSLKDNHQYMEIIIIMSVTRVLSPPSATFHLSSVTRAFSPESYMLFATTLWEVVLILFDRWWLKSRPRDCKSFTHRGTDRGSGMLVWIYLHQVSFLSTSLIDNNNIALITQLLTASINGW